MCLRFSFRGLASGFENLLPTRTLDELIHPKDICSIDARCAGAIQLLVLNERVQDGRRGITFVGREYGCVSPPTEYQSVDHVCKRASLPTPIHGTK